MRATTPPARHVPRCQAPGAAVAISALLALPSASGCTGQAPAVDPVGTYTLQLVGGRALPCEVPHEGSPCVTAGSLVIGADGTCRSRITVSVPPGPKDVSIEREATYTIEGAVLHMRWKGFGVTRGTLEGPVFRMDNEGVVFEYRK